MASLKKYTIFSIFISLFAILFMSHNVGAVNSVLNLDDYSISSSVRSPTIRCNYTNNTSDTTCLFTSNKELYSIDLSPAFPNGQNFYAGDVIEFDLSIYSYSGFDTAVLSGLLSTLSNNGSIVLLSVEQVQNNIGTSSQLDYTFVYTFHFTYYVRANLSGQTFGITSSSSRPLFYFIGETIQGGGVRIILTNYLVWRKNSSGSSQDQQNEINATNDAVDDSESAGGSSSQDAEQGGASLLSAITGFFGVITSASPTNCVFNAPLNTHFGNQRLNVDLCSLTLPPQIGALTSIIAIGIIIPFAIHMFKKFIGLFRSFQS